MSGAALLLALLFAARGAPPREGEVSVALTGPAAPIAPGEPFELVVELEWEAALVPAPFDESALQREGLAVERVATTRRTLAGRMAETRRYRAIAWTRAQVALDAVEARAVAADGRATFTASAPPLVIAVAPRLARDDASPLEWPAELANAPGDAPTKRALLALALLAGLVVPLAIAIAVLRRIDRSPAGGRCGPAARERLAELAAEIAREDDASDASAAAAAKRRRALCAALADVLRDSLAQERGVPAPWRTREELHELLAAAPLAALAPDRHAAFTAALDRLLAAADRAKFAAAAPTAAERSALLVAAERCLALLPEPPR
ncbi:MAG: hypothetical protein JNL90_15200 [Planctomycetes bacterium]|nr:hypothetical protein [Planctomycetota bacterium]